MTDEKKNTQRMQSNSTSLFDPAKIREQAERRAKSIQQPDFSSMTIEEIQQQFHELQVKQIEARLQNEQLSSGSGESEYQAEILTTITENMLDIIGLTDIEGNFIFAGNLHEVLGYEPGFLIGKNVMDLVHPEDLSHLLQEFSQLLVSDVSNPVEYRYRKLDGSYLWFETVGKVINDESGMPHQIVFNTRDITARKLTEEALREREELNRTILSTAMDGFFVIDATGRLIEVNETYCNMSGYDRQELLGLSIHSLEAVETSAEVASHLQKVMIQGEDRFESRHTRKDGSVFDVEVSVQYQPACSQHLVIFIRDITDRKRAEEEIETEARLRNTLLDNVPNCFALILKKQTHEIVASNNTAAAAGAVPGKKCFVICGERGDRCPFCLAPKLWATNKLQQIEVEYRGKWYEGVWAPFTDDLYIHYIFDITDRKKAEENLRYQKQLLESIINGTWDVLAIQYPDHTIERFNQAGYDLLGLPPNKVNGRKCFELIGRDRECSPCATQQALQCKEPVNIEKYVPELGAYLDCRSAPVIDENGDIVRIVEHLRDITERKQAEKEKEKLQAQLRQSQKMEAIGTLAGGIAHDFNNILSSVLGYTELSLDEVEKDSLVHQNLSRILTAGNRAKDLVKQILVFGRKEEQEFLPTPIAPLVKEALKMLRSTFPSFIEIRENISIEQGVVYADPTQLHQVIVNLATNAKQAMGDKDGILEVSVETLSFDENIQKKYPDMAPGNYVQITVSDTGCGISQKYLGKIFEPYFTTSETGTGTGLGLSVVHSIVKTHNGHITVYSEPRKGTTFNVYIPLAEQERSRAASVQEYETLPTGTEKVLIVDDEKPIVAMQQQILEGLGYKVTSSTSSAEALEAFRANPDKFDIVITDMTMPDMTGDRLALNIKEIRPDVPVILCTGFSEKINEQKNGDPGVEGFIMKPVTRTELAKTVRCLLDEAKRQE